MLAITVLALVLDVSGDAPTSSAVAAEAPPSLAPSGRWAFSVSLGRSFYDSQPHDVWPTSDSMWQLSHRQTEFRVTRQGRLLVVGGALHKIAYPAIPDTGAIGVGMVFGAHHPLASWLRVELDGTLGLQSFTGRRTVGGPGALATRSGQVDIYVRMGAGLAFGVASWLEVLVRMNLHVDPGYEQNLLGAASVGLRCPLL